MNTWKEKGKCCYCHKKGHWEQDCHKKKRDEGKGKEKANVASVKGEYSFIIHDSLFLRTNWIANSSAESHIISDCALFLLYTPTPGHKFNGIGGKSNIEGHGNVHALILNSTQTTPIILHNCAHIPSFSGNLLSIKAIDCAGSSATFKNGQAWIIGLDGMELGIGKRTEGRGGLYWMEMQGLPAREEAHAVHGDMSGMKTWEEWHRILGHLNQAVLERLHDKNLADGMHLVNNSPHDYFCEACVHAKHHVAPFPVE
jgi:hypothetical protein